MIRVALLEHFKRELKPLVKKFRTLPQELRQLIDQLETTPEIGSNLGSGLKIKVKRFI